ncbi:MAG: DNA repair protein RadA [Anaerolineales bacterium]|nr:MAG: DNA repair protein RadA [Anaerolineales bacterium]
MARVRTAFVCEQCGHIFPKWSGRCSECGTWNSVVETRVEEDKEKRAARVSLAPTSEPQPLPTIAADGFQRIPVPMGELNRVLGGGIVPGSVVLIGGDPGIGKSTLLLQVSSLLARQEGPVLYVSGEESVQQIKMRAGRLGISDDQLYVLSEINLEQIIAHIERLNPHLAVVDSIQSVYTEELTSAAGGVSQVKECAATLLRLAKASGVPIFIVGHVTKAGAIAGPRVLEHIVDTVLYLEGDRFHAYRLLRSVKNRFGSTNEVGVFEMASQGLMEVANPSEAFLAERLPTAAGSAIAVTMEGTRPLLVEIQALASTTSFGLPRRTANGIDFNRLLLLVAVLNKRVGLRLSDQDVFVNVVGGLRVNEPAADLAVAVAIASSFRDVPVAADLAVVGEIGLSGELRTVSQFSRRLSEAAKLGFRRCLLPKGARRKKDTPSEIEVIGVRSVAEALEVALVK